MTFLQQPLAFPFQPDYSPESFRLSSCNALAFQAVQRWPEWVDQLLLIHGPSFSGKTHLAHLWQTRTGACFYRLGDPFPSDNAFIIDGLGPADLNASLFHFINWVREEKKFCLLLSQQDPLRWPCNLADLTSRLRALVAIELTPPDEAHQTFLLQKNLSDCQMRLTPRQAHRLLLHTERSYEGIKSILKACGANL